MSISCSCRRIRPNSNRPNIGLPLTNAVLINQHFATIEELEEVQLARCAQLQHQPAMIRPTTCFRWWPRQIHKRRGPRKR
jgi:hypothetical protein